MPKAASNAALKKARKQLSITFKNVGISETEESSDSDSSGDLSHIPLKNVKQIPQISNLSINQSGEMEEIVAQLRALNDNMVLFNDRQQQHEQALQRLNQQAEQAQVAGQAQAQVPVQNQDQDQGPDNRVADFYRIPDPIKSLPSFDGNRKQLIAWLTTAEETLNLFKGRIGDQLFKMYVTAVTNKIEGKAKDILCLAGSPKEFELIKDILINALGDRQELSTYKCQLWQHKMTDGMSIHKYYQRSKELIQNIKQLAKQNPNYKENWTAINLFIEEDGLAAFISGLKGTYFGHVQAARPKDVEDAYAFLCKFKSKEIAAHSTSDKQRYNPKPENTSKNERYQKNATQAQTQNEKPKNNQPTPMEIDPSLRSRLTLNKKQINNTEMENSNQESSEEEDEETLEGNTNFCVENATTSRT